MLNSASVTLEQVLDQRPSLFSADRRAAISANGKRHVLLPSKYPEQPLIDRLPNLKRARAKGSFYYYFKSGPRGNEIFVRLPDIKSDEFAWAYQCKLSEIDGTNPPVVRRNNLCKVYFIGCETGPIKIGSSVDVPRRVAGFQSGCPFPILILAQTPGGRSEECSYHKQFAAHRLHGEWFERAPELLAEIDRLNGDRSDPSRAHPMTPRPITQNSADQGHPQGETP